MRNGQEIKHNSNLLFRKVVCVGPVKMSSPYLLIEVVGNDTHRSAKYMSVWMDLRPLKASFSMSSVHIAFTLIVTGRFREASIGMLSSQSNLEWIRVPTQIAFSNSRWFPWPQIFSVPIYMICDF